MFKTSRAPTYCPCAIYNLQTINVALFDCWIFGNVVEVTQMLFLRYRKNPAAWVTSHGLEIFFLIIDLLLISVSAVYALFINKVPCVALPLLPSWFS